MQRFLSQYENNVKIFSPENAPHSAVPTLPSFRALRSPHSLSSHPAVPLSFRGSTATVGIPYSALSPVGFFRGFAPQNDKLAQSPVILPALLPFCPAILSF